MSTQELEARASALVKSIAHLHLPRGSSQYRYTSYCGGRRINNVIGLAVGYRPFEGRVIAINEEFVAVKERGSRFHVITVSQLREPPCVGQQVRITPYTHKRWNGTSLTELEESDVPGIMTMVIGETKARIPVAVSRECRLGEMIEQLEVLIAPDGYRHVAQILVDANASVHSHSDPSEANGGLPFIAFTVRSKIAAGILKISLNGLDYYDVQLAHTDAPEDAEVVRDVCFNELGTAIAGLIDDGEWRYAKVELRGAKKRAA